MDRSSSHLRMKIHRSCSGLLLTSAPKKPTTGPDWFPLVYVIQGTEEVEVGIFLGKLEDLRFTGGGLI